MSHNVNLTPTLPCTEPRDVSLPLGSSRACPDHSQYKALSDGMLASQSGWVATQTVSPGIAVLDEDRERKTVSPLPHDHMNIMYEHEIINNPGEMRLL